MTKNMLRVNNVSKSFGNIVALEDISFDIEPGEFVFLTGHSGAGKTTLLRLILRELLPDTGEIYLENQDITQLKTKEIPLLRQQIGTVFQDFKVLPERTVRENVEVALAVIGLSKDEWTDRVDHVLNLVGLIDRSELFPSQLSGGELQRVSLARALVVNPKVILADEPTGNLDWETAERIMQLFDKINAEGKTILMATHNQNIIDTMKKRVIEVKRGKVKRDEDLSEEHQEKKVKVKVTDKDNAEDEEKPERDE
jgi:cell division transport system ATP-binding protein